MAESFGGRFRNYSGKTKYLLCSIANKYREGKVKRTPVRGVK